MHESDVRQPPMGSEQEHAPFVEKTNDENANKVIENQAHFEKWKVSLQNLLNDDEGSKTFYEFLEREQLGVLFECWYSCEQYRNYTPNKTTAKEIYSRFVRIKDTRLAISDLARNNLAMRLRANDVSENILVEVEQEVFTNLRDVCYPKFLKSDFFTFYCETNGQISLDSTDKHKFGKCHQTAQGLDRGKYSRRQSNEQKSALTPYEKELRGPAAAAAVSNFVNENDSVSMADSRISCESQRGKSIHMCNHDMLPELKDFRPRTQRMTQERLRQMKPEQFAALLTEKLNKVICDRENLDSSKYKVDAVGHEHRTHQPASHYSYETDPSEIDCQSWVMPPGVERFSVAGASSHSGSGTNVEKHRSIKAKAKELHNAVHHSLRNRLGECECHICLERKRRHESYGDTYLPNSLYSDEFHHGDCLEKIRYSDTQNCCCRNNGSCGVTCNLEQKVKSFSPFERTLNQDMSHQADIAAPIDKSKIFAWMEKNEQYKQKYPEPLPSPAVRRKKQTLTSDTSRSVQPIAQDLGMPILPQPDTGTVLEEVKRVLEEPTGYRGSNKKVSAPRGHSMNSSYYHDQHSVYNDVPYERTGSMASGNWSHSDAASIASYNPSQISTVPSSASRLWNQHGYFESRSDVRMDQKSEARSHSTGRHSAMRSVAHSDHSGVRPGSLTRIDPKSSARSDVRSQSTNRSHGSTGSKGRSKNSTTITYYFAGEPIPYRITIPSQEVTLGQFKRETKKGSYRFFFKTISPDDGEVVYEEIRDDNALLPRYEDKVTGKVEKIE